MVINVHKRTVRHIEGRAVIHWFIQLERNAVAHFQYSRRETIELNTVTADITEDVLEENVCKALPLTGVNVVPNDLHACHRMKRSDKVIVKFKCCKQEDLLSINTKITAINLRYLVI